MHILYSRFSSSLGAAGLKPPRGRPLAGEQFLEHIRAAQKRNSPGEAGPGRAGAGPGGSPGPVARGVERAAGKSISEQIRIYREDQLLAHPGGDDIDLDAPDPRGAGVDHDSFLGRIAKDLGDAAENLRNFFEDLFFGSKFRYVDPEGRVGEARRTGLLGTLAESVKNLARGLSLGFLCEEGEAAPETGWERLAYALDKIVGGALKTDLVFGVPGAFLNLADDALICAWNLAETVPDMTLGNNEEGRKFVSGAFDGGQVFMDFVTDCLPAGEAWMRVHAYSLGLEEGSVVPPVLFNLRLPTRYAKDESWATVRNTDFRKSIETLGSILPDIGAGFVTQYALKTSKRK